MEKKRFDFMKKILTSWKRIHVKEQDSRLTKYWLCLKKKSQIQSLGRKLTLELLKLLNFLTKKVLKCWFALFNKNVDFSIL